MTQKQKSNLAKTAITMLQSEIPLNMVHFISGDFPKKRKEVYNTCGTSCCFAGYGPLALNQPIPYEIDTWDTFSKRFYGLSADNYDEWAFVFHSDWPSSKKQAAARALILLRGEMPANYTEKSIYLKRWSVDQIKDDLSGYIIH